MVPRIGTTNRKLFSVVLFSSLLRSAVSFSSFHGSVSFSPHQFPVVWIRVFFPHTSSKLRIGLFFPPFFVADSLHHRWPSSLAVPVGVLPVTGYQLILFCRFPPNVSMWNSTFPPALTEPGVDRMRFNPSYLNLQYPQTTCIKVCPLSQVLLQKRTDLLLLHNITADNKQH